MLHRILPLVCVLFVLGSCNVFAGVNPRSPKFTHLDNKYSCLSQNVDFGTSSPESIELTIRDFAVTFYRQTNTFVTVEFFNPVESSTLISEPRKVCSANCWLKEFEINTSGLTWSASGETLHIVLRNKSFYADPLDKIIVVPTNATHTLYEWQSIISSSYGSLGFYFNNNGYGLVVYDPSDNEWKTRKFAIKPIANMTIRDYCTELARSYGSCIWIADLWDVQHVPQCPYQRFNIINFLKIKLESPS